jgi:hypothetical protein
MEVIQDNFIEMKVKWAISCDTNFFLDDKINSLKNYVLDWANDPIGRWTRLSDP